MTQTKHSNKYYWNFKFNYCLHRNEYQADIFFNKLCYPLNNKSNKEKNPVFPINNYAFYKMGGECAIQMYKNS